MPNRVLEIGELHLVGMRETFTPETLTQIPTLWGKFVPRLPEIRDRKKGWVTYGACRATSDKKIEYTAAVEVVHSVPAPDGLTAFTIPAGPYAMFTHVGHIRDIGATWNTIMDVWMKEDGYIHRNSYDFELYDQRWSPKTGEGEVDIYIAIERSRK